uniref:Uncharacterized protein n=1 Tax=Plectus sambesii TaxID=2011161 RepID=A0A914XSR7_9BILA
MRSFGDPSSEYGAPSMPVFRAAHVWNKGEQLSDNHNALKPSIGQSSAFKPVADSAGDGKRKGLPTPLRQYHRRSRSMAQDPASDASYMIASSDSKENVDGQQQPAILRVAPFTVREYDRLTATVRCQLELTDLNAGVAALNQFIESAEATVFTRKTLQKAVSSCLDSKRAMFFTNALSEASKLSRMNTAHNQTVFASNA